LGYDGHVNGKIPEEGIVIHKVDTSLSRPARVVDVTGNVNDEGAMWTSDNPGSNGNPDPNNDEIFGDGTITV
jgi:hypothetical protein